MVGVIYCKILIWYSGSCFVFFVNNNSGKVVNILVKKSSIYVFLFFVFVGWIWLFSSKYFNVIGIIMNVLSVKLMVFGRFVFFLFNLYSLKLNVSRSVI